MTLKLWLDIIEASTFLLLFYTLMPVIKGDTSCDNYKYSQYNQLKKHLYLYHYYC